MPWQNNGGPWGGGGSGGGGGNRGPWGQGPRGPGGQPPNLEDLLRRGQDRFKEIIPGGGWGKRGFLLAGLVIIGLWLSTGFYRVEPDELGIVTRFGKWVETTQPGLHYHLPAPIESVATPSVTSQNRVDVGLASSDAVRPSRRDTGNESLILTGDENIADVAFSVFWIIDDAGKFLFNVQDPAETVRAVSISAMREVIGRSRLQDAQTEGRERFAAHALKATATPEALALVSTASTYQMIHGAAAIAALWLADRGRVSAAAPFCLALGALLFAAALYGIALADLRLGMVAPIGGTLMLIGWVWLLIAAVIRRA